MAARSCGLLMFRKTSADIEVFLVHPGGPFFKKKDLGYWTIPKGLIQDGEPALEGAVREFFEETGIQPHGPYFELGSIKQKSGKQVFAWAFSGSWDVSQGIESNTFSLEWPPRSGQIHDFPEVDQAGWFSPEKAKLKMMAAQYPLVERLLSLNL